jgi:hypothetical protein
MFLMKHFRIIIIKTKNDIAKTETYVFLVEFAILPIWFQLSSLPFYLLIVEIFPLVESHSIFHFVNIFLDFFFFFFLKKPIFQKKKKKNLFFFIF